MEALKKGPNTVGILHVLPKAASWVLQIGSLRFEGPLHFTKEARVLENKILELGRTLHLLTAARMLEKRILLELGSTLHLPRAARVLAKRIRELGRTLQLTKET